MKHFCDYMRHEILIHVYFALKIEVKRMTALTRALPEAFTQRAVAPCQRALKRHLLSEFPEKKLNDLFGTRAY